MPIKDEWTSDDGKIRLILGDCLEVFPLLDTGSIDLVLTDPPYPKEFESCWKILASSRRCVRVGGSLVTLLGHYQLPLVIDEMRAAGWRYWWIGGVKHGECVNRLIGKRVAVNFKPVLWYVNEKTDHSGWPLDLVTNYDMSKIGHEWRQGEPLFRNWMLHVSPENGVVLDPFMGSGTTGVVCIQTARQFVGIEIDQEKFTFAMNRIKEARRLDKSSFGFKRKSDPVVGFFAKESKK